VELVRQHTPYVEEFHDDAHALTDLLSETIGAAPTCCPLCEGPHENRLLDGSSAYRFA
jgi:hypothetical protein